MPRSPRKRRLGLILGGVLLAGLGIVLVVPGAATSLRRMPGWLVFHAKLKLELEQDPASNVFEVSAGAPVTLAHWVKELQTAWPDADVRVVHGAVHEIAAALLHRGDVEVGERRANQFVPWRMTRWDAEARIHSELMAMKDFLQDENRYVFRKKQP